MRFSFFIALILTLSLAGVQWYQTTKYICPIPIEYRLGVIDKSFDFSADEARLAIEAAERVWEDAIGADIFSYNEQADFVINFVFDDRQATADAQTTDRQRLDTIAEQNEQFRQEIASLQASYEAEQVEFDAQRQVYEADLEEYNTRGTQINDRGGAGPAIFAELESERSRLDATSNRLRAEADDLSNLAQQLNTLSSEGNQLIESYNREVQAYNRQYGESHEFTQGDYRGGEINVYKFSNDAELVSVVAHEFGHALGIDHVEEPDALMYYLLNGQLSQTVELAPSDIAAYQTTCKDQDLGGKIRSVIRHVTSLI